MKGWAVSVLPKARALPAASGPASLASHSVSITTFFRSPPLASEAENLEATDIRALRGTFCTQSAAGRRRRSRPASEEVGGEATWGEAWAPGLEAEVEPEVALPPASARPAKLETTRRAVKAWKCAWTLQSTCSSVWGPAAFNLFLKSWATSPPQSPHGTAHSSWWWAR